MCPGGLQNYVDAWNELKNNQMLCLRIWVQIQQQQAETNPYAPMAEKEILVKLKSAEERADREGWISEGDLKKELRV